MLAIGTRFFGKNPEKDLPRLEKFIDAGLAIGDKVCVAVDPFQDRTDALEFVSHRYAQTNVEWFSVTPWGFAPPLNAIVGRAAAAGADRLLIASAEFPPQREHVQALNDCMQEGVLVAGARFAEHAFDTENVQVVGTGTTVPWNTFALWNMRFLKMYGFSILGDALFDPSKAGVEELATVALYQSLLSTGDYTKYPAAYLVDIPGFVGPWNMDGWDEGRRKNHEAKIKSKNDRPATQLAYAGLKHPTVLHVSGGRTHSA